MTHSVHTSAYKLLPFEEGGNRRKNLSSSCDCISIFQVEVEDFDNEIFVGKKTNLLADRLYSTWCFIVKADSYEYIRG